jgi:alpha-glucosidase (family GH31 glycosyl hydrolase)
MHTFKLIGVVATVALWCQPSWADVKRKKFSTPNAYLIVEILDEDLVHFELSAIGPGPSATEALYTSPMVHKTDYAGPSSFIDGGDILETSDIRIDVDPATLNITLCDKTRGNALLTTIRPEELDGDFKRLRIERGAMQSVYGLGQKFKVQGSADGDWTSLGVREGEAFGNGFGGFQSAAVGNVQIPVMYAVGAGNLNYALFLDNVYKQRWDFTQATWEVRMFGDQLRFYVMTGHDLPDIRRDYLELTGRPPVPPRKAFGLWVSDFGYDNWDQIEMLRSGLRSAGFPIDGFVLDLNWFGGVDFNDPAKSRMGQLNWDESNTDGNAFFFGDPSAHLQSLAADHIGIAAIEESYLANTTDTFLQMPADLTVFHRTGNDCDPTNQTNTIVNVKGFWGEGRMIDWSDVKAGQFIHEKRRFPNLVKKGVTVHWTDLGEPETFDRSGCYEGVEMVASDLKNEHADIHSIYNLLWNKSIWEGYFDKRGQADEFGQINPRPLILARSGASGTQRYGAAMWSGDIASNLESLATHCNAQMHMSFSGVDYYGADVGGFRREVMPYNDKQGTYRGYQEELYTQWFANACWFDVPVRPHTDNEFVKVDPPYPTAPHLVGKMASNLANIRQRYELIPYYYSLAYRAYLAGEPVVPPLVFYYQSDASLRAVGHEKLIGRDLLAAIVARHGEYERDVYLPAGKWVDYHSNEWVASNGQAVTNIPTYREGILRLPVFVRAGAIIPQMHVDDQTMDVYGHRRDGTPVRKELIVRVYASPLASTFTLYEDDGRSLAYDANGNPKYHYRETLLSQEQPAPDTVNFRIAPAVTVGADGPFGGAVSDRQTVVRLVVENARATSVELNGAPLSEHQSRAAFDAASSGWHNAAPNLVEAKSEVMNVSTETSFVFHLSETAKKTSVNFVCDRGFTNPGESIYVVGSIPELGSWDPTKAIKLSPNVYYEYIWNPPPRHNGPGPAAPVWSGVVSGLPPDSKFEWKCVRMREDGTGAAQFEPGANNIHKTTSSGYAGHAYGSF